MASKFKQRAGAPTLIGKTAAALRRARFMRQTTGYVAGVAGCFGIAMLAAWWTPAIRINNQAYDWMLGISNASQISTDIQTQSVVVAIDEKTLNARQGMRYIRSILSEALDKIAPAQPRAVVLDVLLADAVDAIEDKRLSASLRATHNLILPCDVVRTLTGNRWEDPLSAFKESAVALGHVDLDLNHVDGVSRQIPLEDTVGNDRRWAIALQAYSVTQGQPIIESPGDVQVGATVIPASRDAGARPMLIRYLPGIRTISVMDLDRNSSLIRGKTVFVGVTALGVHDRAWTPSGREVPGAEIHAQAFETMQRGKFLVPARNDVEFLLCALIAMAAALIFALRSGWQAYVLGALLIAAAFWMPLQFFRHDIVFPFFAPVAVAWLSTAGAAVFQHFFVRRDLRRSESEKSRYQQAIHWVAHEMRTPLTAIQGSSEIMTRYELPDAKRQELSEMINSESKRLARMIQTFLDVERLADGQMEMKREPFNICDVASSCYQRARPIAERKQINLVLDTSMDASLVGDRELMEYALYNLLTNAIKYSPKATEVQVFASQRGGELRLSVSDQGMGMSADEVKKIFTKFYRTKSAEVSGEVGTGIGLSIVEQIVTHHGGRMEVVTESGKGSCFTMVLKAEVAATPNAETADRRG